MEDTKPVSVSRFSDATFVSKEYITDTQGRIRCFVNIASAKSFVASVLKVPPEQLDWFMYESVTICGDCKTPYLEGTTKLFTLVDKVICEHCYLAS